jgi:DsbC/DsbD-like thiol-disulfide interchange protein
MLVAEPTLAAQAESPWESNFHSKVRLLGGSDAPDADGKRLAGVQIRLDPGWKTYWRMPGDSGIPPEFDWSGSRNLKSAQVLWPAPRRFEDAGGTGLGYADEVIFPILIEPENPGEPIALRLDLHYGTCETLCIPNDAELALDLPADPASGKGNDVLLHQALKRVPEKVGDDRQPALTGVEAEFDADRPRIVFEADFPEGAKETDLIVDGDEIFVPLTRAIEGGEAGKQRFAVSFGSLVEAEMLRGKELIVTMLWEGGAHEARLTLD